MITQIDITGVRYSPDELTRKYVTKKIGRLDRFLPRRDRKTAKAEVILKEVNRAHGNKYEAEVIMHVPDRTLTAKDSTLNMLAAIDIVEAKIAAQMQKYKQIRTDRQGGRGLLARFKRSYQREQQA